MEPLINRHLPSEINELQSYHTGLICIKKEGDTIYISGPLEFHRHYEGRESIASHFDVEISIGKYYPMVLPATRETESQIKDSYEHINGDGTLCLGVPVEERLIFDEQPTLLGYVDRLLIPYLYIYRYWEKHGTYPFGDRARGDEGISQYYIEQLGANAIEFLVFLGIHGYNGHLRCPCGNGRRIKKCRHGKVLRKLDQHHIRGIVREDLSMMQRIATESC